MTDPIDNPSYATDEPSADSDTGFNSGFGGQFSDAVNYGLYNGAFQNGPPDPSANLDVASSVSGSNFMPNWGFTQSSNTNITAKQVRDVQSPSGSNLRFTFGSGSANDEAYVENIVDVGGSRLRVVGGVVRAFVRQTAGAVGGFDLRLMLQLLTVDYTPISNATEQNVTVTTAGVVASVSTHGSGSSASTQAKYLRIRLVANRGTGTAAGSIDVTDVRLERSVSGIVLGERNSPASFGPGYLVQRDGQIWLVPNRSVLSIGASSAGISIDDAGVEVDIGGLLKLLTGQIRFPATQNPSGDPNTMDDFEVGTFTPTVVLATPGSSSFSYSNQIGRYIKVGKWCGISVRVNGTLTIGTGSGTVQVAGLPFTSETVGSNSTVLMLNLTGYTKAGYTQGGMNIGSASAVMATQAAGSGVALAAIAAADVTAGGVMDYRITGWYECAD